MNIDDMVHDKLGWVDDFRAKPGECGSPIAREIYLQSLIQQGTSVRQLKQMGFSKEMVQGTNNRLVKEEYGPKVGDMVKFVAAPPRWKGEDPRQVDERFEGKVGMVFGYAGDDSHGRGGIWNLLVEGDLIQQCGDFLEVINEGR